MVSYMNILLYGVGGLVVAGMALLVALQEKLVYVPVLPGLTKSYAINPSRLRLTYEDVWLSSSDGVRLHSWFIKIFPDCRGSIQNFNFIFATPFRFYLRIKPYLLEECKVKQKNINLACG